MSEPSKPMAVNAKKVALFIGLVYGLSFLLVFVYFGLGGPTTMPGSLLLGVGYMFVPLIVAVVVQAVIFKAPLKEPLRIRFKPNRWFLVAWLLPPLIALATLAMSLLIPGVEFSSDMAGMFERFKDTFTPEQIEKMEHQAQSLPIHPFWLALIQGLVAGITINAVAGLGEEAGWRGLLQRELTPLGFWRSSAIIGVVWGFWHAPLILHGHNYPEHPWAGVFLMTVMAMLLSPLLGYITLKANSVIAAAIFHGTLNATAGLAILVVKGGNDVLVGVTGLAGFVVLFMANASLFAYDRFLTAEPLRRAGT